MHLNLDNSFFFRKTNSKHLFDVSYGIHGSGAKKI